MLKDFQGNVKLETAHPDIIKAVQGELIRIGELESSGQDGICGPRTLKAFRKFKGDNWLGAPDLLGPTTATALLKAEAVVKTPQTKDDHIRLIVGECHRQEILDPRQIAYLLATTQHETAGRYEPIDEYGGKNTRYAPYWGRGYVQLTWHRNYLLYSNLLRRDLVSHPEEVKNPLVAAYILVHGSKYGHFTGLRLNNYITGNRCDFWNARRIINGTDKADLIAGYARQWLSKLNNYDLS